MMQALQMMQAQSQAFMTRIEEKTEAAEARTQQAFRGRTGKDKGMAARYQDFVPTLRKCLWKIKCT